MRAGESEAGSDVGSEDDDFKPLTVDEARRWRSAQVSLSIWRVIAWQGAAVFVVGLLAYLMSGRLSVMWSAAYGGLAVLLPSAMMAWGVTAGRLSKLLSVFAKGSLAALMFWEGIKVLLVVMLLSLAPVWVPELNWLALVAGLVLVLKVYWLAFYVQSRASK
jgi:ATP synthase protein I